MTRLANLNKPHTLEFHYQDKLLVSNVSAEYKDSKQANNTSKELESNIPITIHLKAYYNQDTIPNKDKQSDTQRTMLPNTKDTNQMGIYYLKSLPTHNKGKYKLSYKRTRNI